MGRSLIEQNSAVLGGSTPVINAPQAYCPPVSSSDLSGVMLAVRMSSTTNALISSSGAEYVCFIENLLSHFRVAFIS